MNLNEKVQVSMMKIHKTPKKPHPESFAAYITYKRYLANLEWASEREHKWMQFRFDFLNSQRLQCAYCNKGKLQIYTQDHERLATVDHIWPLSKGGNRYDPTNLCIACEPCNSRKGNKFPIEFFMGVSYDKHDTKKKAA